MSADPHAMLFYGFVIPYQAAPAWLSHDQGRRDSELLVYEPYAQWILSRLAEGDTASIPDGDELQAELAGIR